MQLHELKKQTPDRSKKRIGRGGKRGTTSGRGQKGQKSRAGRNMRPGLRDLIIRTPKKRGYKNKPKSVKATSLTLTALTKLPQGTISKKVLVENKIIKKETEAVKIIKTGTVTGAYTIEKGIEVSAGARDAIVAAGGSVVVL